MSLTHEKVRELLTPCLKGDGQTFIKNDCTADCEYIHVTPAPKTPFGGLYKGTAAISEAVANLEGLLTEAKYTMKIENIIVEGNTAVVQLIISGISKATGEEIDLRDAWVLKVVDGKVAKMYNYTDSLYVAKIAGMMQ